MQSSTNIVKEGEEEEEEKKKKKKSRQRESTTCRKRNKTERQIIAERYGSVLSIRFLTSQEKNQKQNQIPTLSLCGLMPKAFEYIVA